jgi:hypothetical protein
MVEKIDKLRARVEDRARQIEGVGGRLGHLIDEGRKANASRDELGKVLQQARQSDAEA